MRTMVTTDFKGGTAWTDCPGVVIDDVGAAAHLTVATDRPITPHLNAWAATQKEFTVAGHVEEVVRTCSRTVSSPFLRKFNAAKKQRDHMRNMRTSTLSPSSPTRAVKEQHSGQSRTVGRRLNDIAPSTITQHRDYQELKALDVDVLYRRRDEAEHYLQFEVMGPSTSLGFDVRKYTTTSSSASQANNKGSAHKKRKKKKNAVNFSISPAGRAAHRGRTIWRAAGKTMYHFLKQNVKHQQNSNMVDIIAATGVDFPSSEILLQRAFMLRADCFGVQDPRTEPSLKRLLECYEGQGLDREEELREMTADPSKHLHTIRGRLGELDKSIKAIKLLSGKNRVDRQLLRAAHRAKDRVRRRSLHEGHHKLLLTAERMIRSSDPLQLNLDGDALELEPDDCWHSTDRLAGRNTESEPQEPAPDLIASIKRLEYVQVSERSRQELDHNLFDPPMHNIFRSSLTNMKAHPTMTDFQVQASVDIPTDVIIGDRLLIEYSYEHKHDSHMPHSPRDWIGIFVCPEPPEPQEDLKPKRKGGDQFKRREEELGQLIAWRFVVEPMNKGFIFCDVTFEEGLRYRCRYFISCSNCAVASSHEFFPRYPVASLGYPQSIQCGEELEVSYSIDYVHRNHDASDWMGILPIDEETTVKACLERVVLPEGNNGHVSFANGVLYPGTYQVCLFLGEHDHHVIGASAPIDARIESYEKDHERKLRTRDISLSLVGRWDMESEMTLLLDKLLPHLKQCGDNLYCCVNIVNIQEELQPDNFISSTNLARMFWYVQHCRPLFIFLLGDQMGQLVKGENLDMSQFDVNVFPWLQEMAAQPQGSEASVTELLLSACYKIPRLVDPQLTSYCLFYFPVVTMRSRRHPVIEKKGVMESVSLLNHSRITMRALKRDILSSGTQGNEYENVQDLTVKLLKRVLDAITDLYPQEDAPSPGDYMAMMMDQQLERSGIGVMPSLEATRYVQSVKPNGAVVYTPASTVQKGFSIFELLDKYMDDESMCTPLIVVDRYGSGLSSVLATWVTSYVRRAAHVVVKSIPQYGDCFSRVALVTRTAEYRRVLLYLDLELLSHRLDTTSLLYFIMYSVRQVSTTIVPPELPDPNCDLLPLFKEWLAVTQTEQLILVLDGLDYLRMRGEDPVEWLPNSVSPLVRIIGTSSPIGRVVYACDSDDRLWTTVRRRSELSVTDKDKLIDKFLRGAKAGMIREWITPVLRSEKTSYHLALRTLLQELMVVAPKLQGMQGLQDVRPDDCDEPTAAELTYLKTRMAELLDAPDLVGLYKLRIRVLATSDLSFRHAVCLLRIAQRGLSELEIILALLHLEEYEAELLYQRRRAAAAEFSSDVEGSCDTRMTAVKRRIMDPLSKRFNDFRRDSWRQLYMSLKRVTKKVMGLYVLKNRHMYRAVDACFFEKDSSNMTYTSVLIDVFGSEAPSQRKGTELVFLLYRGLRAVLRVEPDSAPATGAASSVASPTPSGKRGAIKRIMDRLFDVLTDPHLFQFLYSPFRRSIYLEYMYQTGVKQMDIYSRMTQRFEDVFKVTPAGPTGPKQYQLSVIQERRKGVSKKLEKAERKRQAAAGAPTLTVDALRTLLLMGMFVFDHLRLYDLGQELLECTLMILLQARAFGDEMGNASHFYCGVKSVPVVVDTVYALAKAYLLRLIASHETVAGKATSTEILHPKLYQAYTELISRSSRPRSRAAVARSTYELFLAEDVDVEQEDAQYAALDKGTTGEATSDEMAAAMATQREKLKVDPVQLHTSFHTLELVVRKVGTVLDQRRDLRTPEIDNVLNSYYPLCIDAFDDLWTSGLGMSRLKGDILNGADDVAESAAEMITGSAAGPAEGTARPLTSPSRRLKKSPIRASTPSPASARIRRSMAPIARSNVVRQADVHDLKRVDNGSHKSSETGDEDEDEDDEGDDNSQRRPLPEHAVAKLGKSGIHDRFVLEGSHTTTEESSSLHLESNVTHATFTFRSFDTFCVTKPHAELLDETNDLPNAEANNRSLSTVTHMARSLRQGAGKAGPRVLGTSVSPQQGGMG